MILKKSIKVIALIFILLFSSCDESIILEYSNPNDPYSDNYPSPLKIIDASENMVSLEWIDNSEGKSEFIIERAETILGDYREICKVKSGTSSYIDKFELITNKDYFYRLNYVKDNKIYRVSNICKVNIGFNPNISLSAGELTDENTILLNWAHTKGLEKAFIVEQMNLKNNKGFVKIAELTNNNSSYLVKNLDRNDKYKFRVYANSDHNQSQYSDTVAVYFGFYSNNKSNLEGTYSFNRNTVEYAPNTNSFFATGDDYYKLPFMIYGNGTYKLNLYGTFAKYHPSGNFIAIAPCVFPAYEHKISIVNTLNGRIEFDVDLEANCIDFNSDGSKMICSGAYSKSDIPFLAKYDFINKKVIWNYDGYKLNIVKFTPKGDKIIGIQYSDINYKVLVISAEDGTVLKTIDPEGYYIPFLCISNDGKYMALSACDEPYIAGGGDIQIWDINTMEKIASINGATNCAVFTRDSKYIIANNKGKIRFFRTPDFELAGELESSGSAISLSANYTTDYLVAANQYGLASVYSLKQKWQLLK